jgi:molybdate transport system regulatory protein
MRATSTTPAQPSHPDAGPKPRRLRHRVMVQGKWVFGPGKADLLSAIKKHGSLAAAARSMKMSYMRAWVLLQEMQAAFSEPVAELHRGGKAKGGATLTPTGERAVALYRQMEEEALTATEKNWQAFRKLLC